MDLIVPITFITLDEIKSFKFDKTEYLSYIKTILNICDYETFRDNYDKNDEPINFTNFIALSEFKFLKTIMSVHNGSDYIDDILWKHDTPDHPF